MQAKVAQAHGAFWLACGVEINICAGAKAVWEILTDAESFPRWNSTVTRVEGEIRDGAKIRLSVPGTERRFTPKVCFVIPGGRMTWSGGLLPLFKGVRTFSLRPCADGSTDFVMDERFAGLMLPLVRKALPDFRPIFERYALDLKQEAERRA